LRNKPPAILIKEDGQFTLTMIDQSGKPASANVLDRQMEKPKTSKKSRQILSNESLAF